MGLFDLLRSGRGPKIKEVAAQLQCTYAEEDEFGLFSLIMDFQLCRKGTSHRIRNILSKVLEEESLRVHIFDYLYVMQTGKVRVAREQSVLFFDSKELGLPRFILQPEGFFDQISSWIGFEDIDFPEDPGFSVRYYLKGDEEQLIRQTFKGAAVEYFASTPGWSVEGDNYFLIAYIDHKLQAPEEISQFLTKGLEINSLFKGKGYNG